LQSDVQQEYRFDVRLAGAFALEATSVTEGTPYTIFLPEFLLVFTAFDVSAKHKHVMRKTHCLTGSKYCLFRSKISPLTRMYFKMDICYIISVFYNT